jgi:two-component system OmpR family sensor kinase
MFPKSIRWRLQAWQGFLLACILSGFGATAYQLHRTNALNQVDEELERRIAPLTTDVRGIPPGILRENLLPFGEPSGPPPFEPGRDGPRFDPGRDGPPQRERGPEFRGSRRGRPEGLPENREIRLSPLSTRLFEDPSTNSFYYLVWARGGLPIKVATNAPAGLARPLRDFTGTRIQVRTREAYREAFQFTEFGECVLVGRSIAADLAGWRRFAWLLAAIGGGVLALGLGGGWLLTTRALRPVTEISATASRIAEGNLAERINVAETDSELGRLAGVLNHTFARLEGSFAQQRQFTADASHELRTPLAVIISDAQTTLARERSAAEYRETVETCLGAAQQMRRLAHSLLELARYDAGQEAIERQPLDLAERARACVARLQPLARERDLQVHCDLPPAPARGDADRLDQVITNLLANAIYYNREGGEVRVTTRTVDGFAELTVSDTGPGLAEEDLPHVFERFYRADKSRARAEGRAGLGLAICKAIVEAHGGTISAGSAPGAGAAFTFRLPA